MTDVYKRNKRYILEFYSVVKNNDIINFACKWIEIENALLSEATQTQKE